jgi:ribosomal protein S18 acetylase RimI-like enzyme
MMSAETCHIRPARFDDLDRLAEIEIDAFVTLADALGIRGGARPMRRSDLEQSLDNDLLWVAVVGTADLPVGFLASALLDGNLYVAEIDVARDWQRRGIGRRLMATAITDARQRKLPGVTLTTDRFVAFNAPFYATIGFTEIGEQDAAPELRATLEQEIANGMQAGRRVAMMLRFFEL